MKLKIVFLLSISVLLFLWFCERNLTGIQPLQPYDWPVSAPQAQGVDAVRLENAFGAADTLDFFYSAVVVRNGYLIGERYYRGYTETSPFNVRSVSKSFLSTLVGIALDKGILSSPDQKVLLFFPEYHPATMDPRKRDVTIRHLLTMRMGIAGDHDIYSQIWSSSNWILATWEQPLFSAPGAEFRYNTFQTHLLAVLLSRAAGENMLSFGERELFDQIGIAVRKWEQDPQGNYFGGNNMYFTTRDLARFGFLYLNGGKVEGREVVPQSWVSASLANHSGFQSVNWGVLEEVNYGYLWWMGKVATFPVKFALGHGGQYVLLFPGLNLIVAITSDAYVGWGTADEHERAALAWVRNSLLPAVTPMPPIVRKSAGILPMSIPEMIEPIN